MRYRQLGSSSLNVSVICFGGGHLADFAAYGSSETEAIEAVRYAIDKGINFYDTSEWYGQGEGEQVLSRALGTDRKRVYIATKVGLHNHIDRGIRDSRPERIVQHIDKALNRLNTDYVDLFQIHWPDPYVPFEESWAAMEQVQKSGKARYIGVSNYRPAEMERCMTVGAVHSLQTCFHMFRREPMADLLPFCQANEIGTMIWGPLAHGLLTGKFSTSSPPNWPADDWRMDMPIMKGAGLQHCMEAIDRLLDFCRERGHTLTELAIAWTLSVPGVTTLVTGSRKPSHLADQLGGADWILTEDERKELAHVLQTAPTWGQLGGDEEYGGHHSIPIELRPSLH